MTDLHSHPHHEPRGKAASLNRIAFSATVHCLTGCAIGEMLGMVIGTALGLGTAATIILAVILAFIFGYMLTLIPLFRAGLAWDAAFRLAFASDTASITVMEIVDNAIMLVIPGAWMLDWAACCSGAAWPFPWLSRASPRGRSTFGLSVAGVAMR